MNAYLAVPAQGPPGARDPSPAARPPAAEPRGGIRTVLLATDLTAASEAATRHAVDLASMLKARLLVVNVIDPNRRKPGGQASRVDQLRAEREPSLLEIVGAARSRGVAAEYLLWTGEPGKSIVAAAEAEGADMVIVGTRALDRAGRFLLGSVSEYVVYHSACPVLVAR